MRLLNKCIATELDVPVLVDLMREFYGESNYQLDKIWAAKVFSELLRDHSRGMVWIAFEDECPVGYVVLTFRFSMEFGGIDGFIDDLFVRSAYRKRGYGGFLLETLLAECERRGLLAVHVETSIENIPAVALYKNRGLYDRKRLLLTRRLTEHREELLPGATAPNR